MDTNLGWLQASLEDKTSRANREGKEHERLLLSEKSFEAHLWHRPDGSERVEDSQYQLEGAVAKKGGAQKAVGFLQKRLNTI